MRRVAEQGSSLPKLASLWAPFVIHATAMLKNGGRLAMVLPMEMFHATYGRPVLRHLSDRFASLHVLTFKTRLFPDLSQDCVLLLADDYGRTDADASLHWRDLDGPADLPTLGASSPVVPRSRRLDCRRALRRPPPHRAVPFPSPPATSTATCSRHRASAASATSPASASATSAATTTSFTSQPPTLSAGAFPLTSSRPPSARAGPSPASASRPTTGPPPNRSATPRISSRCRRPCSTAAYHLRCEATSTRARRPAFTGRTSAASARRDTACPTCTGQTPF